MKKQNVFFYLSALTSVAIIVMLFLPWYIVPASQAGRHWLVELVLGFAPSLQSSLPAVFLENNALSLWDLLIESLNLHTIILRLPDLFMTMINAIGGGNVFGGLGNFFKSLWGLIGSMELLVFLLPVFLGVLIVHVLYLRSIFRPETDPFFPGTVTVLLAGIAIFLLLFGSDLICSVVTSADLVTSDHIWTFLGLNYWTPVPYIWFGLTLIQKWLLAKFAHKKEVISYT